MAELPTGFRPPHGYRAPQVTETNEPLWNDCTVCATTRLLLIGRRGRGLPWRDGELFELRERIRRATGVPDRDPSGESLGTNQRQCRDAAEKVTGYHLSEPAWLSRAELLAHLAAGGAAVIIGKIAPGEGWSSWYRRWTSSTRYSHAASIQGLFMAVPHGATKPEPCTWLHDPLAPNSYAGEPLPIAQLYRFMAGFAWNGTTFHLTVQPGELLQEDERMIRTQLQRWKAPKGTPFFDSPNGPQAGQLGAARTVTAVGYALVGGQEFNAWLAVYLTTTAGDGERAPKLVWVRRKSLTERVASDPVWLAQLAALLDTGQPVEGESPEPVDCGPAVEAAVTAALEPWHQYASAVEAWAGQVAGMRAAQEAAWTGLPEQPQEPEEAPHP